MRVKPKKRGMWSNWHKTAAKQKHICLNVDLHSPTIVRGMRYIWHYHKYYSWLEKRRFNLKNPVDISLLFHGNSGFADRYKHNGKAKKRTV